MIFREDFKTDEEIGILKLACENSLKAFIKVIHYYMTGSSFIFKDFHDEIIEQLEARAKYKTTKNLIINIPTGFGKSIIVEYFKSWCFARNKNICFLYTSYSDKLIQKLSSEIMEIIKSEPYQAMWNYELKKDKKSKANWSIEGSIGRAGLTAGSMGGTITGLDAGNPAIEGFCGALVLDDIMKAGDEIYEAKRNLCVEYYTRKLITRLRRSDVPIILIMQRLHEEDLSGYIKNEGKYGNSLTQEQKNKWKKSWDEICVKALVNEKSIWEDKVSTEMLIEERERIPWVFYSQRQQEPNTNINTNFKGLNFTEDKELIFNGIGLVDKSFGGSDGTAFVIAKRVKIGNQEKIVLLGKHWQKHIDDCLTEIKALRERYKTGSIYTENNDDKGYTAKNNGFIQYHEDMNKHIKIMNYLYSYWKDIVFLPETDEFFIRQIQSYNENALHDDCPDACASIIRQLTRKPSIEFL